MPKKPYPGIARVSGCGFCMFNIENRIPGKEKIIYNSENTRQLNIEENPSPRSLHSRGWIFNFYAESGIAMNYIASRKCIYSLKKRFKNPPALKKTRAYIAETRKTESQSEWICALMASLTSPKLEVDMENFKLVSNLTITMKIPYKALNFNISIIFNWCELYSIYPAAISKAAGSKKLSFTHIGNVSLMKNKPIKSLWLSDNDPSRWKVYDSVSPNSFTVKLIGSKWAKSQIHKLNDPNKAILLSSKVSKTSSAAGEALSAPNVMAAIVKSPPRITKMLKAEYCT